MFWIAGGEHVIHALRRVSDAGVVVFLDSQLMHRDWEGVTFYDLIFPLFLFIVGVSLVFSIDKILAKKGKRAAFTRILKRSFLLYILGVIFSSGSFSLEEIRLMGVLQRIALCYFFAAILYSTLKVREEGSNLANYIDKHYLPLKKYDGDHDPEGLLSTLPAISTCLLGALAGRLIRSDDFTDQERVRVLLVGGVVGILLGFLWGIQFPVIKKIWTSSYVLVTAGYSSIFLAAFYQVIEIWRVRRWAAPFVWIGMNAIAIYIIAGFVGGVFRYIGAASTAQGPLGLKVHWVITLIYW
jgi:predicted acyltransferase